VAISVYVVAALGVTMVALVAARETARDDFEGRPRRFVREREREREPTSAATG
jgi:hypothetical protein